MDTQEAEQQQVSVSPEAVRLAVQMAKDTYEEELQRLRAVTERATAVITLSGVALSVYVAFMLRPVVDAGIDRMDIVLVWLTLVCLIAGFAFALTVFMPRDLERLDVSFVVEDGFLQNPHVEAELSVADAYVNLIQKNERVIDRKFVALRRSIGAVLAGLVLVAAQAIVFVVGHLEP